MKKIMIGLVRFYQRFISPAFGAHCRYQPTCSQYMIDAINTHGSLKGMVMGTARILRCHPLVKGGIDYVPPFFSIRKNKDETYYGPYRYRVHTKQPIQPLKSDELLPWELLLSADPDRSMIETYIDESQIYVYREWNQILGVIVVKQHRNDCYEIMNLAVSDSRQGEGIGKKLVDYVVASLKKKCQPTQTIDFIVKTALQPPSALSFYQKCQFEIEQVVENYFIDTYDKPIFEDGVLVKDQVILKQKIAGNR